MSITSTLLKAGGIAAASILGMFVVYKVVKDKEALGDLMFNESEYTK